MLPMGLEVVGCNIVRDSESQHSAQQMVQDLGLPVRSVSELLMSRNDNFCLNLIP